MGDVIFSFSNEEEIVCSKDLELFSLFFVVLLCAVY